MDRGRVERESIRWLMRAVGSDTHDLRCTGRSGAPRRRFRPSRAERTCSGPRSNFVDCATAIASAAVNRPLLRIDRESLLQLERSMTREWLETDGVGGYASSTVPMCPTRRYHGLLVAPPPGSTKRHLFLSRFEETFVSGGKSVPISMARYRGL